MQHILSLEIPPLPQPITYEDAILMTGSCFAENMSERMKQYKFNVLANPHGILFNPISVADSLNTYIDERLYTKDDLFYLNELWNSWEHHTRFSDISQEAALENINRAQKEAAAFIRNAKWLVITPGTAFQYYLKENGKTVANNHRAPSQWFEKKLLTADEIVNAFRHTIDKLKNINPDINLIFTVSPVRHIRDGVTDNNRSKARLIEATHAICEAYDFAYYFPAYELVIDVLRDYRYYDADLVHPNTQAVSFVWEHLVKACISEQTQQVMKEVQEIVAAKAHKPRFPQTDAHRKFLEANRLKVLRLKEQYPYISLNEELEYFSRS